MEMTLPKILTGDRRRTEKKLAANSGGFFVHANYHVYLEIWLNTTENV